MKTSERQELDSGKSKGKKTLGRMSFHLLVLVLVLAAAAGLYFLLHRGPGAGPGGQGAFEALKGRWLRPDGGYVVDIREVGADGRMTASYFNPRPINVSRAEATREGDETKVFIELRDVNYPGATYNLTFDPKSDQLRGVYYQPALQQGFEVFFVRMN
jgi:hypothetical protein